MFRHLIHLLKYEIYLKIELAKQVKIPGRYGWILTINLQYSIIYNAKYLIYDKNDNISVLWFICLRDYIPLKLGLIHLLDSSKYRRGLIIPVNLSQKLFGRS